MVGTGHSAYTDRFHELARLVPHLVTPESKRIERYVYGLAPQIQGMVAATEPKTIQKAVQIVGTLTDEALRKGSIKKNPEKRGNRGEPSKDRNGRDDNKRTRTKNPFAMTTNPVRGGHFAKDCRVAPRNVNHVNARNPRRETWSGGQVLKSGGQVVKSGGQDYQEYRLAIPETMLTEAIKQSKSYQMFIKYSTCQIPPKKSRGKGSQGKKTVDTHVTEVVESEPEPAKKRPISKSISLTEVEEVEATRKVHARIMTESIPTPAKRSSDTSQKLKGVQSLTPEEQEAVDTMKELKESRKSSKRQPGTRGSHKGTGSKPGVPNEPAVGSTASSEGTGVKPGVPDEDKDITKEKVILEWGEDEDSEHDDDDNADAEKDDKDDDVDDEGDDEHINVDEEMGEPEIIKQEKTEKEVLTDVAKLDTVKSAEEVGDAEKTIVSSSQVKESTVFPMPSSSLSISSGFEVDVSSLMDITIQQETPQIQSPSILKVPMTVIPETSNLPPILETPAFTTVSSSQVTPIISHVKQSSTPIPTPPITIDAPTVTTIVLESDVLSVVQLRVENLEKDMSKFKRLDISTEAFAALQTHVPIAVDNYLDSKITKKKTPTIDLEQETENTYSDILKLKKEYVEKQQTTQFTIKSTNKAALKEFDTIEDHKRKHNDDDDDDDEDPSAGPNQGKTTKRRRTKEFGSTKKPSATKDTSKGKAPFKGSKTGKSASAKEPIEEPIDEVVMDDTGEDVGHDADQLQYSSQHKKDKTLKWFKQPPIPPTPDSEWNKRQAVLDQPAQPWFNQMVSALKDPLTFDYLMDTLINFFKIVSIELEYNFQECFNALIEKLDWNNPEGDRYPFDLSKPLSLQELHDRQTVVADYFFNNDLEYLKSSDPINTYTTSITKTKAARYTIFGIKDMVLTLWSPHKSGYDKDVARGIKHWGKRRKLCVKVEKLHGYGYLEEIVVKRVDRQLYTFKEGDFVNLHLNDIEDMLLFVVQHKLFHLNDSDIVDFTMSLWMFTGSLIVKRRVEDIQLGVESYQKKLNITAPQRTFDEIDCKEIYTPSHKPPGVVYEDQNQQKRVMRADELYKFSDGTLQKVQDELHHRVHDFKL
ncbi:hypothetical protein Tco_1394515 [Tanacetum coccineum]